MAWMPATQAVENVNSGVTIGGEDNSSPLFVRPPWQARLLIPIEGWRPCRGSQSYFLPWNAFPHPNIERYASLELLSLSESICILSISSSYLANPPHSRSVREYSASSFLKRSLISHLTNT